MVLYHSPEALPYKNMNYCIKRFVTRNNSFVLTDTNTCINKVINMLLIHTYMHSGVITNDDIIKKNLYYIFSSN